jgi:Leu/Phe-tRNA-protein transferase
MVSTPDDTGTVILGLIKNPEPYRRRTFYLASEWITLPEMAAAYSRGQSSFFSPSLHSLLYRAEPAALLPSDRGARPPRRLPRRLPPRLA